ncbi:hypothetical protein [Lentzea aerocolonigenes]|uniref:hypothetical protein n=1 Tax=Lentzea aerocolonigenes TaxID=68170 RepID=UPI0004C2DB4F|nr:hypothetical protein [Lentzea aerocolonigenes]MCP2247052.1 hypothetical protein [Lentzea aerocolonigenes]
MDLGDRRRQRRERLRNEYGTAKVSQADDNTIALIAFAVLLLGILAGFILQEQIAGALRQAYCTPVSCQVLPQALTGWAIAVAPLPVFFWHRNAAFYLGMFLVGLMGTFFITAARSYDGLWLLPIVYFVVGLLFVPFSLWIARLAAPGWRAAAVAGQHWLLLVSFVLWLA